MTATYPARQRTAYRGAVYGIDILDHHTGQVVPNDYVGQTRQRGRARENQHRDTQPFSDRIVGSPRVLWEGICTDEELDAIEREFIRKLRPRMNWIHNEDNPDQIPKWVQVEQRHERDDAAGVARWVPPDQRQRASLLEWEPVGRTVTSTAVCRPRKRWRPWQRHLLGIGVTFLVLAGTGWTVLATQHLLDGSTAVADPIAAVVAAVWGWFGFPGAGKRWRRRFRNARRRFR